MQKCTGGFTMLETIIFLAVSTAMFVSAIIVFGGSQSDTEFSQSVREFESSLNDIINDTATGVFPDIQDVECDYSGNVPVYTASAGSRSGDNNGCLFIGKIIQFGDDSDNEKYIVHSLIGDNDIASTQEGVIDPETDLRPHSLYSDSGSLQFNSEEEFELKWGTEITHSFYRRSGVTLEYAWGIGVLYRSFGSGGNAANSRSGVANIGLYAVTANDNDALLFSNSRTDRQTLRESIPNPDQRDLEQDLQDVFFICLNGGSNQKAAIQIGKSGGGLNATATFSPPAECELP